MLPISSAQIPHFLYFIFIIFIFDFPFFILPLLLNFDKRKSKGKGGKCEKRDKKKPQNHREGKGMEGIWTMEEDNKR